MRDVDQHLDGHCVTQNSIWVFLVFLRRWLHFSIFLYILLFLLLLLLLEDYVLLLCLHKDGLLICCRIRVKNGNLIIKNGNLIITHQNCLCLCLPPESIGFTPSHFLLLTIYEQGRSEKMRERGSVEG